MTHEYEEPMPHLSQTVDYDRSEWDADQAGFHKQVWSNVAQEYSAAFLAFVAALIFILGIIVGANA